jgi:hypothetical protein
MRHRTICQQSEHCSQPIANNILSLLDTCIVTYRTIMKNSHSTECDMHVLRDLKYGSLVTTRRLDASLLFMWIPNWHLLVNRSSCASLFSHLADELCTWISLRRMCDKSPSPKAILDSSHPNIVRFSAIKWPTKRRVNANRFSKTKFRCSPRIGTYKIQLSRYNYIDLTCRLVNSWLKYN